MLLYVVAFIGGVLTIASPCILPVLPLVFARVDQPFRRSGLPLLAGMAITFAGVAAVATFAGSWVVRANEGGRVVAMIVFAILGLTLLFPKLAEFLSRPFVRLGGVAQGSPGAPPGIGRSVLLGISTGLLWTPCAGPILGLILTGAAIEGASLKSALLLFIFAAGAACSLAVALLAGNKVLKMMKRSLGVETWIRKGLGVAVLLGVAAIASGSETGVLARLSYASTAGFEQRIVTRIHELTSTRAANRESNPAPANAATVALVPVALGNEGPMPSLNGAIEWINSKPLTTEELRGKVVLVDFWTYSCINCLRAEPYVEAWAEKYKDAGLVVIGVHTPEFAFEREPANVKKAVKDLKITYPVALDSNYAIWKAFHNEYWPADYFVDKTGTIRFHAFGEGKYDESEQVIQQLLKDNGATVQAGGFVSVQGTGVEAAPDSKDTMSPETYVGYARQQQFASAEPLKRDEPFKYTVSPRLNLNQWGLAGEWNVRDWNAILTEAPGKILFRFHARDFHAVLGPGPDGKPIRFKILLDGAPAGDDRGMDVDDKGRGTVKEFRLYQLIRQRGTVEDRTIEIDFLDPGVEAFSFTFG